MMRNRFSSLRNRFSSQVLRQPDNALLAFLLGTAIGVMLTLSVVELWLNNALENDFLEVRRSMSFSGPSRSACGHCWS